MPGNLSNLFTKESGFKLSYQNPISFVSVNPQCKVIIRLHNFLPSTLIEAVRLVNYINYENLPGTGNSELIA